MQNDLAGSRVLVVGLARSGLAVSRLLLRLGAVPILSDTRTDIEGIPPLVAGGAKARLGERSEALLAGVRLVIVSPAVPPEAPVIAAAEAAGIPVLSELAFAAEHLSGHKLAITGTNGKTTTSALLGEILKNAGKMARVAGNIGLPLSQVAMEARDGDYTVIEVSSFQLEHIGAFHPEGAALLNLTPDHLNRHGTMEAYGALKERLIAQQTKHDFFVYGADDPFAAQVAGRAKARTVPFSRLTRLRQGAWVQDGQVTLAGRALLPIDELSLPGPHNLENALAAAAFAAGLEIPPAVIRHTLRTFAGVPHRMETVRTLDGVRYINDSKGTNPEASMRGVEGMRVPTVLIAGGDEKGTDFTVFARAIAQNDQIRHVVLIGKTAARIEEALRIEGYTHITHAGFDFESAIKTARTLSTEGGAVLLSPACASFDMFKDFEARGDEFRRIVEGMG